jgi:hypothetical protein
MCFADPPRTRTTRASEYRRADVRPRAARAWPGRTRAFRTRGDELIDGVPTSRIDDREHQRPTIVRTLRNESVPLEGSLWIEPSSGRVVRTLKTEGTPDPGSRSRPCIPMSDGFRWRPRRWSIRVDHFTATATGRGLSKRLRVAGYRATLQPPFNYRGTELDRIPVVRQRNECRSRE